MISLLKRSELHLDPAWVVVYLATLRNLVAFVLRENVALVVAAIDILDRLTRRMLQYLSVRLMRIH